MQTLKRGFAVAALLFSPLTMAQDINAQLTTWFSQRLAGFSDEVVVTLRSSPNLLPSCEQPAFSMTGSAKLWGNVNVVARCANEKRYLQVNVQATGNYVAVAAPVARGGKLTSANVTLKTWQAGSVTAANGTGYPVRFRMPSVCAISLPGSGTAYDDTSGLARQSGATSTGHRQWRGVQRQCGRSGDE
ncbi:flagellar basal body P-ring protein FlgA [Salmonella enterica subsp. enterica]|nr:flagellar basal body P-ring protein FlgA [Salmonella enterica subsp. enterica]